VTEQNAQRYSTLTQFMKTKKECSHPEGIEHPVSDLTVEEKEMEEVKNNIGSSRSVLIVVCQRWGWRTANWSSRTI